VSVLWLYLFFISGRSGRCEPVQQDAGELQIATKTKQKWEKGEEYECPLALAHLLHFAKERTHLTTIFATSLPPPSAQVQMYLKWQAEPVEVRSPKECTKKYI